MEAVSSQEWFMPVRLAVLRRFDTISKIKLQPIDIENTPAESPSGPAIFLSVADFNA